jgi:hypothetical protein
MKKFLAFLLVAFIAVSSIFADSSILFVEKSNENTIGLFGVLFGYDESRDMKFGVVFFRPVGGDRVLFAPEFYVEQEGGKSVKYDAYGIVPCLPITVVAPEWFEFYDKVPNSSLIQMIIIFPNWFDFSKDVLFVAKTSYDTTWHTYKAPLGMEEKNPEIQLWYRGELAR